MNVQEAIKATLPDNLPDGKSLLEQGGRLSTGVTIGSLEF